MNRKALGKGLGALIPEAPTESAGGIVVELPVDEIVRNEEQPRTRFDEEGISFPFPQQDVHVYHEPADADGPAESSTVSYPGGR